MRTHLFSAAKAEELVKAGHRVVLVRLETSPEDLRGMIAADLRPSAQSLRARIDVLRGHLDVETKQERIADLERQAGFPEFWSDAGRARAVLRDKAMLEKTVNAWVEADRLAAAASPQRKTRATGKVKA